MNSVAAHFLVDEENQYSEIEDQFNEGEDQVFDREEDQVFGGEDVGAT